MKDKIDVIWLCIISSAITAMLTAGLCHQNKKANLTRLEYRAKQWSLQGQDTLVNIYTGQMYFSDSLIRTIPHQAQEWYVATSGADAMIIKDIMTACKTSSDIEMVQWMIEVYGVKKENLGTLLQWSFEDEKENGYRRIPMHTIAELYYLSERLYFNKDYSNLYKEDKDIYDFLTDNKTHYTR